LLLQLELLPYYRPQLRLVHSRLTYDDNGSPAELLYIKSAQKRCDYRWSISPTISTAISGRTYSTVDVGDRAIWPPAFKRNDYLQNRRHKYAACSITSSLLHAFSITVYRMFIHETACVDVKRFFYFAALLHNYGIIQNVCISCEV